MFNQPFNNQPNQQYPQNYGGYQQQYTPPQPSMSFAIVEGRPSVDNYLVGTNVTAVLADFTNMKLYIKERDANNILKPLREFDLNEKVQQTIPANPVNNNQIQNESGIQKQIDDLRSMMTDFINSQKNTSNNNSNKSKGGNN